MIKAPIPKNENERLKALLELDFLDSEKDEAFDDIVEMAAELCDTSMASICLIDRERQWFKSHKGISVSETPRDLSFCGHTILSKETMIIEDPLNDLRFHDNPYVTGDFNLRFYAGAPLILSNGFIIGTLCVFDNKSKVISATQIRHLEILSRQVVNLIELRLKLRELQTASRIVVEQQETIKSHERLAVIGKLSSGVSHEINNPLAIISGSVLIVKTMIQKGESIETISSQLSRIDQTVTRLTNIGKALRTIASSKSEGLSDPETIEKTFHRMIEETKKAA